MDLSRKAESLVRSRQLPAVGVQAAWTIDGPILVEVPPINRNLSYWYVGIGVSYDISSLYKTNKSLSKSRAATRQAMDRLEATRENVELDIRADYLRYLEAYEELKTRRKGVKLSERNYRTTSTRYSADVALITDMLDAAKTDYEAKKARYEMLARQRAATSSVVSETRQRIAQNDAGIELAKALLETAGQFGRQFREGPSARACQDRFFSRQR